MFRDGRELLSEIATQVVTDHHDAFIVQLFGSRASNLGPARIAELLNAGVITQDQLDKTLVPGAGCDYLEFIFHVSNHLSDYHGDLDAIDTMRDWDIKRWTGVVADRVNQLKDEPVDTYNVPERGRVSVMLPASIPKPPTSGSLGNSLKPDVPKGMREFEVHGYQQAVRHAGSFARGLGVEMSQDMERIVFEEWDKETIVREVDAERRAEKLEIIREETAQEFVGAKDWRALSRRLADKSKEYERDWERIARTELQACYNDARVISGVNDFGSDTQIARIHEGGACQDCIRLCGDSQNPEVFSVQELFENGTNVGKKRSEWKATIFPIHPNCRCDTVIVPPGFTIKDGNMVRKEDNE